MHQANDKPALGLIIISVIMVFMAILTDIYWLASWIGRSFPRSLPLPEEVARAFALPDIIGSLLMYLGAYGLLRRRLWAIYITLVAIGMNFGSSLFFLSLTRTSFLNILGPTLIFILYASIYLWHRRGLFLMELKEKPDMQ